mgnify:CR=1 FL=1
MIKKKKSKIEHMHGNLCLTHNCVYASSDAFYYFFITRPQKKMGRNEKDQKKDQKKKAYQMIRQTLRPKF